MICCLRGSSKSLEKVMKRFVGDVIAPQCYCTAIIWYIFSPASQDTLPSCSCFKMSPALPLQLSNNRNPVNRFPFSIYVPAPCSSYEVDLSKRRKKSNYDISTALIAHESPTEKDVCAHLMKAGRGSDWVYPAEVSHCSDIKNHHCRRHTKIEDERKVSTATR